MDAFAFVEDLEVIESSQLDGWCSGMRCSLIAKQRSDHAEGHDKLISTVNGGTGSSIQCRLDGLRVRGAMVQPTCCPFTKVARTRPYNSMSL